MAEEKKEKGKKRKGGGGVASHYYTHTGAVKVLAIKVLTHIRTIYLQCVHGAS